MQPLLALDFDGVISDSAPESFWVALRGWEEQRRAEVPDLGKEPPPPRLGEIEAHPRYARFLELMPLGNRAEDYAVVLDLIDAGASVADQAAYDAARAASDPGRLDAFHARFYARREELARRHAEAWHALMGPYPGLCAVLRGLARDFQLAIATSKDRRSVAALLAAYGIAELFAPERVLDKEAGRSKTAHLRALRDGAGVPPGATLFVDDKVNHLDAVAELGVRCALASWGYNGARERALARDHGHMLFALEDFEAQVRVWAAGLGDRAAAP